MPLSIDDCRAKVSKRVGKVSTDSSTFETLVGDAVVLHQAADFPKAVEKVLPHSALLPAALLLQTLANERSLASIHTQAVDILACLEGNEKQTGQRNAELHAQATHNLGTCMHHLGHLDAAKSLYAEVRAMDHHAPHSVSRCRPEHRRTLIAACSLLHARRCTHIGARTLVHPACLFTGFPCR